MKLFLILILLLSGCSYNFNYYISLQQDGGSKIGDILVETTKPKTTTVSTDTQASVIP